MTPHLNITCLWRWRLYYYLSFLLDICLEYIKSDLKVLIFLYKECGQRFVQTLFWLNDSVYRFPRLRETSTISLDFFLIISGPRSCQYQVFVSLIGSAQVVRLRTRGEGSCRHLFGRIPSRSHWWSLRVMGQKVLQIKTCRKVKEWLWDDSDIDIMTGPNLIEVVKLGEVPNFYGDGNLFDPLDIDIDQGRVLPWKISSSTTMRGYRGSSRGNWGLKMKGHVDAFSRTWRCIKQITSSEIGASRYHLLPVDSTHKWHQWWSYHYWGMSQLSFGRSGRPWLVGGPFFGILITTIFFWMIWLRNEGAGNFVLTNCSPLT